MKIIIVYDNTMIPNELIQDVIGEKGFGDVIVKRKKLVDIYKYNILQCGGRERLEKIDWKEINTIYDIERLCISIQKNLRTNDDVRVIHCFSNYIITDCAKAQLTFEKIFYINEELLIQSEGKYAAIMFPTGEGYTEYLKKAIEYKSSYLALQDQHSSVLPIEGMTFIGEIFSFIQCITGNFDSRYFNSLKGSEYRIRKSSFNKEKIKSEYQYYHLLPEHMKCWFVMPFDYRETADEASYEMERLHMTDIAIKWVHGSIREEEFKELMDMYFYFFRDRSKKKVELSEYKKIRDELYVDKVKRRIDNLKELDAFKKINFLLENDESIKSIDCLYNRYLKLKERMEIKVCYQSESVIGHGDPCFANAMYNHSTKTLKFIDPKGALTEKDLWTNPYYDIAKLSHSICGRYDFFNNAMFDITIDENFNYQLSIPFDNTVYKQLFRQKVEENGYDYWTVRLYEASLFLSMLPLHIDYPHKVLGFILNANEILKEIEKNV